MHCMGECPDIKPSERKHSGKDSMEEFFKGETKRACTNDKCRKVTSPRGACVCECDGILMFLVSVEFPLCCISTYFMHVFIEHLLCARHIS